MDHMMPGMDGLKTTRKLREMGYKHPIVALTANALIGQEEMFLANGFDGFISKPIDSRELNKIIIKLIQNKKLRQEEEPGETISVPGRSEIVAAAAMDIKNALSVLEDLMPKINIGGVSVTNLELFTTTVHGMKSALANIGEDKLSGAALKLERAANDRDAAVISAGTPDFINALRLLIYKIEQSKIKDSEAVSGKISGDDIKFLQDKMNIINEACVKLDIKDAKTALAEIRQKQWNYKINETLDEISMCILRGEFVKIEDVIKKANNILLSENEKI
jgi:CheY-like chemotaxis protein